MFKLQNGPFNDGPDVVYIRADAQSDARSASVGLDGFTPAGVEEVDAAPEDANVYEITGSALVLPEGAVDE